MPTAVPTPVPAPTSFAVVGTGWRSEFFLRLAQAAPERLRVTAVVARTPAAAERVAARWDVRTVATVDEALADRPDFVVASVSWASMPEVTRHLVAAGVRTLAETPPAPDLAGLRRLWDDVGGSGLVQVAEQYTLMPGHAARLAVVRAGTIGQVTGVEVASTHLYHATSLVRGFLGVGFEEAVVNARTFVAPLVDPLTFDGWVPDPQPRPATTTLATLDFGDGRTGLYDFVDNQWWNPLRARRIVVRGSHGEVVDDTVTRLTPDGVVTSPVAYRRTGVDMNLEGNDVTHASFDGRVVWRNAWAGTRFSEDDLAVADLLEATGAWARDEGPGPYGLAEACQDHALGLAIEESARTGQDVRVAKEVWAS
ncbi:Gfo/Idh/MocA family protein [Cellulomonas endophytica]|uniref:Gfo/Idh/MocA family protein n=1 Tax=Cellulomonas endophytica TaxID=2494735 RepID=UPI001F0C465F|nr:Gfo/Idh/MocA family oxidoreductase [Cellulomonas endophytica]